MPEPGDSSQKRRRQRSATHGASARHLVSPAQWRESMALGAPPSLRIFAIAGFQSALAVLLAIVVTHFSPWPEMVGFASIGALAALFGRFSTVQRRMRIVVICALLLAWYVSAGTATHWSPNFQMPIPS